MATDDDMDVRKFDIVQISPENDETLGGSFVLVTFVGKSGIHGYIRIPGSSKKMGQIFVKKKWKDACFVGRAEWIPKEMA